MAQLVSVRRKLGQQDSAHDLLLEAASILSEQGPESLSSECPSDCCEQTFAYGYNVTGGGSSCSLTMVGHLTPMWLDGEQDATQVTLSLRQFSCGRATNPMAPGLQGCHCRTAVLQGMPSSWRGWLRSWEMQAWWRRLRSYCSSCMLPSRP